MHVIICMCMYVRACVCRTLMDQLDEVVGFYTDDDGGVLKELSFGAVKFEFASYKNHNDDSSRFSTKALLMSSKCWWQLNGSRWPSLQRIAIRIFSIGTSSSASERNFSALGHIWSKKANSLSAKNAEMLAFVNTNLRALTSLDTKKAPSSFVLSSDLEPEPKDAEDGHEPETEPDSEPDSDSDSDSE